MYALVAESIWSALPLALLAATPLLLAVQGELVVQRCGIINLGLEGMMLTAAMTAVLAAQAADSALAGFAGGVAGALAVAAIFGVFVLVLKSDQIVTGTAINLLALGTTSFVYQELRDSAVFVESIPKLATDFILPAAWIVLPALIAMLLWSTTFGLRLRACGENPEAVRAAGASVPLHRAAALGIEAVAAGLAGAYLSLGVSSGFAENMTAGRGFIALAIVIFGRWKVKGVLVGTAIFGIAAAMQYALQAANTGIAYHLLLAVPYVVTLLILCGFAGRVRAPQSLGK